MILVNLENVVKKYPMGAHDFVALNQINLQFEKGEFCGLVGPSGSGKTTLLNIIGSLDKPSEGKAMVIGKETSKMSENAAAQLRNKHMGFIFQTYNLLPVYTVYENVELPLLLLKLPARERRKKVIASLEWVNLMDKINSRPNQLSGGQAQRVAVARAIVKQPELVLADEPTANLDADNSHNILNMMVKLNTELKLTFIFATHDDKVIQYLKRKIRLVDGKVVEDNKVR